MTSNWLKYYYFFTTEYFKKLFNIQHHPAVGPQSSVIVMWSIQAPFHCLLGIHYEHHPSTFIIYPHSHSLSHQIWPQCSIIYLRHVSDVWWCLEGKNCLLFVNCSISWDVGVTIVRCSGLERSRRGKMFYCNIRTPVHRIAIPKVMWLLYPKFWVQTFGIATLWTGVSVFWNLHTAFPL